MDADGVVSANDFLGQPEVRVYSIDFIMPTHMPGLLVIICLPVGRCRVQAMDSPMQLTNHRPTASARVLHIHAKAEMDSRDRPTDRQVSGERLE
jgi:hypothetical protein